MEPMPDPLDGLHPSWRRCLELAWESWREGSIPVGSVITDATGRIVAEGRNRAFGAPAPEAALAGTYVAHAEMNALAKLAPGDYPEHTIWSSLEPCFMCSAAVFHSHVGTVRFAVSDPLMTGVSSLPETNAWVRTRWPARHGPLEGHAGDFAGLLHLLWHLQRKPDGVVVRAYLRAERRLVAAAERIAAAGALSCAEQSLPDALAAVSGDLATLHKA
jgi:tRNA(Arg) A34 adenosine deaminase TadA